MSFSVGAWLHDIPSTEYDVNGKRAIVRHLCFGPLETRIWYETMDGRYWRELHFIEGPQAGELYADSISQSEMLDVIKSEAALCIIFGDMDMNALLCSEIERIKSKARNLKFINCQIAQDGN